MTSLAAISDASTIADGWRGWAFVAAVILIGGMVAVILAITARPHNVPVMGDELSTLDRLDRPRCTFDWCDEPVQVHIRAGYETWLFCLEHGTPYLTQEETA